MTFVACGFSGVQAQQIPQFSQYMFNGLYINPAYAGYKENMYAHLMYRNQWIGLDGSPQTVLLGIDGDLGKGSNLGFIYANDRVGATTTNSIGLSYAFRFQVSDKARLAFGLSGGAIYYGLNKAKLNPDRLLLSTENVWRPMVDIGAYFDMEEFYAGFSVMGALPHRAESGTMQIMRSDPNFFLTLGGSLKITEEFALAPSTLLKTDFRSPLCWDLNLMAVYAQRLWFGASYRTGLNFTYKDREFSPESLRQMNALAILAEVFLTSNLRLGFAYDFDLNRLTTEYNGGIEVSLGYYLLKPRRHYGNPRYMNRRW